MYIIGYKQSKDFICKKKSHNEFSAKQISCMCNAGLEELLLPKIDAYKHLIMQDVMDKVEQNDK